MLAYLLIAAQPTVNPMLGPSQSALINVGARFPACMKDVDSIPLTTEFACTLSLSLWQPWVLTALP